MSEIRATTISDAAGTGPVTLTKQSAAKAWVNFNGTGTIAARDSYNVASLTDNGTGSYAYNLTSAMDDANYMCGSNGATTAINTTVRNAASIPSSASVVLIGMRNTSNTDSDAANMHGSIHGDLA